MSGDEYDQLERAKHPSLYESGHLCFVLFGPLSLVNHDCKSDVAFGKPSKLPTHTADAAEPAKQTFPLLKRNSDDHAGIGKEWETKLLRLKKLNEHLGWKAGEQILVRYGTKPENCFCKSCERLTVQSAPAKVALRPTKKAKH